MSGDSGSFLHSANIISNVGSFGDVLHKVIKMKEYNYLCSRLPKLKDALPLSGAGSSSFYAKNILEIPQISLII